MVMADNLPEPSVLLADRGYDYDIYRRRLRARDPEQRPNPPASSTPARSNSAARGGSSSDSIWATA